MVGLGTASLPRASTGSSRYAQLFGRAGSVVKLVLPFVFVLAIWQASALAFGLSNYLYPRPALVLRTFGVLVAHGILLSYTETSMWRWFVGVGVGTAVAIPVALAFSFYRPLARMMFPLINFFTAIVELAWIPLFVLWFGYGFKVIVLSIGYVTFFPVLANTMSGIGQIPKVSVQAAQTLGANRLQVALHVLLPGSLPGTVTGVRTGAGYGFRSLIGAEMIAAQSGLGYMIFESRANQLTQRTVAGMITIGVLWLLVDRLYLRSIERATVERWGLVRKAR
ncbi:MAG: ABC transporter permease [Actinobacteria bacterium]|jgi:ABC-type nitrate/sulfonate/bicarbonate transport system permease component|nr:ABC transporter permease [Actinomycetota bacterium]